MFGNTRLLRQFFEIHANMFSDKGTSDRQREHAADFDYINGTSPCKVLEYHHHTHTAHTRLLTSALKTHTKALKTSALGAHTSQ